MVLSACDADCDSNRQKNKLISAMLAAQHEAENSW